MQKSGMAPRVLVVIPAYNESANIESVVHSVMTAGYDYIVINDGSADDTLAICQKNKFNVLDLKENLGIGGAVQAGHKYAKAMGYDIDVQFDGDGQHDVKFIPDLIEAIECGADLAIGSRFSRNMTEGFRSSFMRRVGIRWISGWIKLFTHQHVTDPTSGFRACGKRTIDLFARNYPIDYPEPESIVSALRHKYTVRDVPVIMHERSGGESSIGPLASIYYMVKVSVAIAIVGLSRKKDA